jgi:hypothetical protein
MPKRLAITVAGAVSLGSYEAGVLYEVLAAIAAHNTSPNTAAADKIFIDVITGASAGGMSATILAQKLLFDAGSISGVDSNALHDPWINDISLTAMLNLAAGEDPGHSIFSSQLIEAISKKYITARYATVPPPAPVSHPAIDPTNTVKLGLALSNLDGVDYGMPLRTGGSFTYTRYQDQYRREYTVSTASDDGAIWEDARNAAVSCGAFPFAFAVKAVQRTAADYLNPVPSGFPPLGLRFAYTDGGVFQNEPLGMAKDFVDIIDNHQDSDSRFYLFIAPGAKDSTIATDPNNPPLTDQNANLVATAKALVGAIFYQARFHDWIMAESVNQDVALLNRRAAQLLADLLSGIAQASVIGPAANAFLALMQAEAPATLTDAFVTSSLARLQQQFAAGYATLSNSPLLPGAADAWIRSIFVLELAADLGTRDEMNIYAVTATDAELAGSSLFAFAGFFDQGIRQHDYDVGRNKAKEFISAQNAGPATGGLGPFNYTPGPPIPIDPSYANFDPTKLSQDERTSLRDRLADRADTLLTEADIGTFYRWVVVTFIIKPKINTWLSL